MKHKNIGVNPDAITPTLQAFRNMVLAGKIPRDKARQELGISKTYLSYILNNRRPITKDIIFKIFTIVASEQLVNNKEYVIK